MSFAAGPFALSMERFFFLLAFIVALVVGWLIGRQHGVKVEPTLTRMLLGGAISARLAFVLLYFEDYLADPISMIDIRDGGFIYEVGLMVALAIAAHRAWRRPTLRGPLGGALVGGLLTWGLAVGAINMMTAMQPRLPAVVLTALNGDTAPLSQFEGQPMVVNLWATWCPPCRREMPVLEEAQKHQTQIAFLFVNQGESAEQIQNYLAAAGLDINNVLLDPYSETLQMMGGNGLPSTYFFNAAGELVESHFGELSTASLKHNLKKIHSSQANE